MTVHCGVVTITESAKTNRQGSLQDITPIGWHIDSQWSRLSGKTPGEGAVQRTHKYEANIKAAGCNSHFQTLLPTFYQRLSSQAAVMEALVAVGLAANVLQFIDFTAELFRTYGDLRDNAASSGYVDYRILAEHLLPIAERIEASSRTLSQGPVPQASSAASSQQGTVQSVAAGCCELARNLLTRLDAYGVNPTQNGSRFHRTKDVFRTIWRKKEINDYVQRLESFRQALAFHIVLDSQPALEAIRSSQATKDDIKTVQDDIKTVRDKITALESPLRDLLLDVGNEIKTHHAALSSSVQSFLTENAQLHSRTANQATSYHLTTLSRLQDLGRSIESMREDIRTPQTYQQRSLQSAAETSVSSSTFQARVVRSDTTPDALRYLIHELLQHQFDDFKEALVGEAKKEIRGALSSALAEAQRAICKDLREMDDPGVEHPRSLSGPGHTSTYDSVTGVFDAGSRGAQACLLQPTGAKPSQDTRCDANEDMELMYRRWRRINTRAGVFYVLTSENVVFRPGQPLLSLFDLEVHFRPFPHWFSKGFSITYQKMTDARGSPKFGFQLQAYRVLDKDHEVFQAIREGDLKRVRDMLAQKTMIPSDRDSNGYTLLHRAAQYRQLDICKALIQSGADVNARNHWGGDVVDSLFDSLIWKRSASSGPHSLWRPTIKVLHYFRSLKHSRLERTCELSYWPKFTATTLTDMFDHIHGPVRESDVRDYMSAILAEGVVFDTPGTQTFMKACVGGLCYWVSGDWEPTFDQLERAQEQVTGFFGAIVDRRMGFDGFSFNPQIPVAYAAAHLVWRIGLGWRFSQVRNWFRPKCVVYHGLYVTPRLAMVLQILEHIISEGIKQRPESIFDVCEGETIYDKFCYGDLTNIWEDILRAHGFDPDWVWNEGKKRRTGLQTGETSAHEVRGPISASEILQVKRRKGYTKDNEA
ncbi:hypothetical protein GGR56DRAFT_616852 [Xylariaceae sp. FL0804]|nr:hypothetical protein GGR56DRAFT_616852 [Xylariaceae sp. FL0804]